MKPNDPLQVEEEVGELLIDHAPPPGTRDLPPITNGRSVDRFRHEDAVGLGRYLRAARLNHGWSYDELSRRADLDRVTIIALENGLYQPRRINRLWLSKLARALGENLDDLALLLGEPLQRSSVLLNDRPSSQSPGDSIDEGLTVKPAPVTYFGLGRRNSRDLYRSLRSARDPERLFFDK